MSFHFSYRFRTSCGAAEHCLSRRRCSSIRHIPYYAYATYGMSRPSDRCGLTNQGNRRPPAGAKRCQRGVRVDHEVRPHAFPILRLKSVARSESSMLSAAKMRCRQKSAGGAFVSPKSSSSSSANSISLCRKHSSKPLTVAPSRPGAGTSGNWARAAFKCLAVTAHILSSSFRSIGRGLTNQANRRAAPKFARNEPRAGPSG